MKRAVLLLAALAVVVLGTILYLQSNGAERTSAAHSKSASARAELLNAAGVVVGRAHLNEQEGGDVVRVRIQVDAPLATLSAGFHGFHVHETGTCTAPTFLLAGFHLDLGGTGTGGTTHPNEAGDLPVLLVNADGTGEARFTTDRFTVADLLAGDGTALIIHEGRDNYANIPARYLPPPIDQATLDTGDAGPRKACGVIQRD